MSSVIQIREPEPSDYERWLGLWRGYQEFYKVDLEPEVTQVTWRRIQDPDEPILARLAVCDGEIAGLVHWVFHRTTWAVADTCYLEDLFVDPQYRRRGIARILMEAVFDAAKAAGSDSTYWLTQKTNASGISLYQKLAKQTEFIHFSRPSRS